MFYIKLAIITAITTLVLVYGNQQMKNKKQGTVPNTKTAVFSASSSTAMVKLKSNSIVNQAQGKIEKSVAAVSQKTLEAAQQVLGVATEKVKENAQGSMQKVVNQGFDALIDQIEKLPKEEQKKIKEKICK